MGCWGERGTGEACMRRVACGVDVRTWLANRCEGIVRTDYERGVVVMDGVQMNEEEGW